MDTTLEDKTKELMEESRMVLVQFSIDRVSLGVHSMGKTNFFQMLMFCLHVTAMFLKQICKSAWKVVFLRLAILVIIIAGDFCMIKKKTAYICKDTLGN